MTDIAKLGYAVDSSQLKNATNELDRNTKAAERTASATSKYEKSAERLGRRLGTLIGTGIVAATVAFGALIGKTINYADRVDEISNRLNISTEQLSKWGYAAKLSGTDLESLSRGIGQLSKNAAAALDGDSTLGRLFKDGLQIDVRDAQGNLKSIEQLLPQVADRFKALDNQTLETALAMKLFGRSGAELLEFLNRGSEGIAGLGDELEDLGGVISGDTARRAAEFKDELDRLREATGGWAQQVMAALLPALKDAVVDLRDLIKEGDLAHNTVVLISTALRVGVGILEAYNNAVNRVSLAFEFAAKAGAGFMEIQQNLGPGGLFSEGSIAGGVEKIKQAAAEGDKALSDLEKPRKIPLEVVFAGEGAEPKGLFAKSEAEVASAGRAKNLQDRLNKLLADPGGGRPKGAGRKRKSEAEQAAERLEDAYRRAMDTANERIALFGKEGEAAQIRYATELGELAKLDPLKKAELIAAYERLDQMQREKDLAQELAEKDQQRHEAMQDVLSAIKEETQLVGMSANEQEVWNNLKWAGVDAESAWGQEIVNSTRELQKQRETMEYQIDVADGLRSSTRGLFQDLYEGKSAVDSLTNALGNLMDAIFDASVKALTQSAFGQQGDPGGGWFGNLIGSFFGGAGGGSQGSIMDLFSSFGSGGFFGGGRAYGGDMRGDRFYRVGERNHPELAHIGGAQYLIPGDRGRVEPISGNGPRGGDTFNITVPVTGRVDARTRNQIASEITRTQRRASRYV